MNVYLFGFQKKKNSTAQPLLNTGDVFDMKLKEETSVLNPAIIINPSSQGMPSPFTPSYYTYAYIQKFERYYFISDWQYINKMWVAYLTEDVLASFKSVIGTESFYVERSASAYNGDIVDNLYPAKTDVSISFVTTATSWYNVAPSGGSYILGVINYQNSAHVGAVSYYAMSSSQLNALMNFLFSSDIFNASTITEIGEDLYKSLFNPFQYIVSCMWLPGSPSTFGGTSTTIKVGYWDTGVTAYTSTALAMIEPVTATIPNHPQASTRGSYLNRAPFTRLTLYVPPFGEIPIDPSFTAIGKYLYGKTMVDCITGQATLRVCINSNSSYNGKACAEKTAMFGVPIQLAQVLSDYSGAISSLASGATSGSLAGFISSAIGATVQTAIASQAPKVSTNGANGSFINFALDPGLVVEHYKLVDEDLADLGRPLMATRQINGLSGYIKCAEGHFSGSCLDSERDIINGFLVSGFFYE